MFYTNYANRPYLSEIKEPVRPEDYEDKKKFDIYIKDLDIFQIGKIPFGTIMDDDTITEQSGYQTTSQLYESFVRAGINLQAYRLGTTPDDVLERLDDIFESYGELDIVDQQEILQNAFNNLKQNLEKLNAEKQQEKQPETPQQEPEETPQQV